MDFPISTSPFYDWKSDYRNGAEEVHGSCSVVVRIHEGIDEIYSGVVNISCVGAHGGLKEIRHRVNHLREPLLIMHYPPPFGASKGDSKKSSKFKQMFPTNFAHQSGVNYPKVDVWWTGTDIIVGVDVRLDASSTACVHTNADAQSVHCEVPNNLHFPKTIPTSRWQIRPGKVQHLQQGINPFLHFFILKT